jgi:hypothetical protein
MSVCNYCGKDRNPTGNFYRHCGCDFSNESSKQRIEIKPSVDSAVMEVERLEAKVKELEGKVTYYENVLSVIDPDGEGRAVYDEDPEGFD